LRNFLHAAITEIPITTVARMNNLFFIFFIYFNKLKLEIKI